MNLITTPHVVIIGGGFGGLYAAKALRRAPVKVTLVDRRNFHLFQPLLYQMATGALSAGDIASPLRAVLSGQKNVTVFAAEAVDIIPEQRLVTLHDGELAYDTLIVATGVSHFYFGNDEWAETAPGLKTLEDAVEMRRQIFLAFEAAEREMDPERRQASMTFVVVGGGPTGVELAGALGELAHGTLKNDFQNIDPAEARILLLEGTERILPTYDPRLSLKAENHLANLGVTVQTRTLVTDIRDGLVTVRYSDGVDPADQVEQIRAQTILWAAGVKASPMGQVLARRAGAKLDRAGRVIVAPDLSVPGYPDIFVIGDLAHFAHQDEQPLPGVATVAMQEGQYVANLIKARCENRTLPPFRYRDKGSLAVIGRNAAVARIGSWHFDGFLAWLIWLFVHIAYLIEFDNKILVFIQWAWSYFTRRRGSRLITVGEILPQVRLENNAWVARQRVLEHDAVK